MQRIKYIPKWIEYSNLISKKKIVNLKRMMRNFPKMQHLEKNILKIKKYKLDTQETSLDNTKSFKRNSYERENS